LSSSVNRKFTKWMQWFRFLQLSNRNEYHRSRRRNWKYNTKNWSNKTNSSIKKSNTLIPNNLTLKMVGNVKF
jgi:hypothetical protein